MAKVKLTVDGFWVKLTDQHYPFIIDSDAVIHQSNIYQSEEEMNPIYCVKLDPKDEQKLSKAFANLHELMLKIEDKYAKEFEV